MSLSVPLSVRLSNAAVDMRVTSQLRSLDYRSAAHGGHASATFSLERPLMRGAPELAPYTDVIVYDTRSAEIQWQGKLEDPGRGSGSDGQIWSCTAMGPSARAQDQTLPLIYFDTDLTKFGKSPPSDAGSLTEVESDPSGASETDMLKCQFPAGETIGNNSRAQTTYDAIYEAGQAIGFFRVDRIGGKADVDYLCEAILGDETSRVVSTELSANLTVAGATSNRYIGDDFPAGRSRLSLRLYRTSGGATTVADDLTWVAWSDFRIAGRRHLKDATWATGAAQIRNGGVYASDVVEDLLGRCLTSYDGANAVVDVTTHNIDQLAYPDGVTPQEVFDDLMALEPAYYWAAWEGIPSRFEWTAWPTEVAYDVNVNDGYDAPSSTMELYNAVVVRWRNSRGILKTSEYTSTVGHLTDVGLTRQALVDLGDEVGSQGNADRIGANFLADHAYPANAGTITIAGPQLNILTGRVEWPHQIRPGRLIRVRGIQASPDSLNATSPDGVTVMRIVATDYSTSSNQVVCELDSYSRALARSLARAHRDRFRRR